MKNWKNICEEKDKEIARLKAENAGLIEAIHKLSKEQDNAQPAWKECMMQRFTKVE